MFCVAQDTALHKCCCRAVEGDSRSMQIQRFKKGDLICKESSHGDNMYIITSGRVIVYKCVGDQQFDLAQLTSKNKACL